MIIVNNVSPDDTVASMFSEELALAMSYKDNVKLLAVPYSAKAFSSYRPNIIINISFDTAFKSTMKGYSIAAYKRTELVDLMSYIFSQYIPARVTSGYEPLPNSPYSSGQDIQLNLGYASNSYDVAWYSSVDNRTELIKDLVHMIYGDFSKIPVTVNPDIGILPDPYFLSNTWSGSYTVENDFYLGAPIKACTIYADSEINIEPSYTESRKHILRMLVKSVGRVSTMHVKSGDGILKTKDLDAVDKWVVLDFTDLAPNGSLAIGSNASIKIAATMLAPESIFGTLANSYYFDDPRLNYSPIDPNITARPAAGIGNKSAESLVSTAQSLIDAINKAPIDTKAFSSAISEFTKHIGDLKVTEFAKIDPTKINTIYKDMEKNFPVLNDIVKKQNTAQLIEKLKSTETMVSHITKSSLTDVFEKNKSWQAELEKRAKEAAERLKLEVKL